MGARQAKNAPLYTKYEFDICHVRSLRGRLFDILDNQMEKNESEIQANKLKGCTGCREGSCSYFDFPSYPVGTPGASPGNYIPGQTTSSYKQHKVKIWKRDTFWVSLSVYNFKPFIISDSISCFPHSKSVNLRRETQNLLIWGKLIVIIAFHFSQRIDLVCAFQVLIWPDIIVTAGSSQELP